MQRRCHSAVNTVSISQLFRRKFHWLDHCKVSSIALFCFSGIVFSFSSLVNLSCLNCTNLSSSFWRFSPTSLRRPSYRFCSALRLCSLLIILSSRSLRSFCNLAFSSSQWVPRLVFQSMTSAHRFRLAVPEWTGLIGVFLCACLHILSNCDLCLPLAPSSLFALHRSRS